MKYWIFLFCYSTILFSCSDPKTELLNNISGIWKPIGEKGQLILDYRENKELFVIDKDTSQANIIDINFNSKIITFDRPDFEPSQMTIHFIEEDNTSFLMIINSRKTTKLELLKKF